MYEMFSHQSFEESLKKQAEEEADKIEEEKFDEDLAWAEEMEKLEEEREADKPAKEDVPPTQPTNPSADPSNMEWMKKVIEQEKQKHGDDFGEDLSFSMEDD